MTRNLEATVIAVDPLEGKYKVHGPDGKEYQFEQRRAITLTGYFLLDNGVEKGMFHKMSENSSKVGGTIFLYDKQMNDLKYAAFFEKKDDSYVVKLDLNDAGEEIHPLDYLLRKIAGK